MRYDHAYIARSTSLCITTTQKGDAYCETPPDKDEKEMASPLSELLLLIQNEYVLVENNSGIDGWIREVNKIHAGQYGTVNHGITRDTIIDALSGGLIGLRIVIWD